MKRIFTLSALLLALAVGAVAQTEITRPCPASSQRAKVTIDRRGNIDLAPCPGRSVTVDGGAIGGGGSEASATEVLTGTNTGKYVSAASLAALWEQGSNVASASTVSLGNGGYFNVTGTATINDIDFATDRAGRAAWIRFSGVLTLTNGANLILPTGANITTAVGDTAFIASEGSDTIRILSYQRADGTALAGGGGGSSDLTTGGSLPGTCTAGEQFLVTGGRQFSCTATDTWSEVALASDSGSVGGQFIRRNTGNTGFENYTLRHTAGVTIQSPTASENVTLLFVTQAITITDLRAVARGSSPSVSWTVRFASNRNDGGTEVRLLGDTTTTESGESFTTFTDATIPANSWVWIETTAATDATEFHLTIIYTKD